ncbi:MAG: radical SAM protein [Candidatus Omnitrophica bacterium]|nr:radical SAM protein [Candidatus Omnitrophota bacterium]
MQKNFLNIKFLPFKPLLLPRILKNYFNILLRRKPVLRVVTLALDYACQFSCDYCYVKSLEAEESKAMTLSISDYERIIRQSQECGALNFHFTGGDPLIFKDLYKISALVDKKRNILSLVTNGLRLEEEALKLKKNGFDLVIVSIDSPKAEIHDSLRNFPGAWEKAFSGINAALSQKLKVMIAMVVTNENLNDGQVDELIKICRSKGIDLQLLPIRPQRPEDHEALLDVEGRRRFYEYVSEKDVRWDGQSSYLSARCLAARERLYITPKGEVFSCDFIQDSFGNAREEAIFDIWQRMLNTEPYNKVNYHCLSSFCREFIKTP